MRSLLDDLRHTSTPLTLTSREYLVEAVKRAHVALLRLAIGRDDEEPIELEARTAELRRYALWLEEAALRERLPEGEMERALNLAASLYEFAGKLSGRPEGDSDIFRPPLNDLLRSSILGSLTAYQAQASMAARRAREQISRLPTASAEARLHHAVASVILSFLGRQFHVAFTQGIALRTGAQEAARELRAHDATNAEILAVDQATAIGLACHTAAVGMLVGAADLVKGAGEVLGQIAEAAFESDDSQRYWLARRLRLVTKSMYAASMHRVLAEMDVSLDYRRALAREEVLELWEPQLEAIRKGLLNRNDARNFVVSIPTGGGKTLIAELAILAALCSEDTHGWAVYVTPTRALVNQVSSDLRRRLEDSRIRVRTVLAGAEQSAFIEQEVDLLTAERSVTVTTPEKLDAYYRNAREIFDSCRLVVFDEVHKVGEPGRGALLESLITRFAALQPSTRIIMLSGVMSNYEEFVSWLGGDGTESVVARRRPTRQIRGVAVRHSPKTIGTPSDRADTRRVDFSGGLVIVHEADDLEGRIEVQIPRVFSGFFTEKQFSRGWREDRQLPRSSINDHAVGLASALSHAPGTTLVFVGTTAWAESCCRKIRLGTAADAEYLSEREQLAKFLETELGEGHELADLCRRGVAFHHARLPAAVQRVLELALERGWIKVMFATGTLREGLNTPATNVILAGDTIPGEGGERIQVSQADFENLAGRAGRPFREAEGRAILIPNLLAQATTVGKRYLLTGDEALRVRSQLRNLAARLSGGEEDLLGLPVTDQALLLGLRAAGIDGEDDFTEFFAQSLWALQEDDEEGELTRGAARGCARTFSAAEDALGEDRVSIASRTGLSLSSSEAIRATLIQHVETLRADTFPIRDSIDEVLPILLEASLQLPEVQRGELRSGTGWQSHLAAVRGWVAGEPYGAILRHAVDAGVLRERAGVGGAVRYCTDIANWLSWSFGACYVIAQSLVQPLDPLVGILPLLVRYGVSAPAAAYISLLGVADRTAAQELGTRYEQAGGLLSIEAVAQWMSEVDPHLEEFFPEVALRAELLRRQAFGARGRSLSYRLTQLTVWRDVRPGQILTFATGERGDLVVVDDRGNQVGTPNDPPLIRDFSRGELRTIVGVVTTSSVAGQGSGNVTIAIVR